MRGSGGIAETPKRIRKAPVSGRGLAFSDTGLEDGEMASLKRDQAACPGVRLRSAAFLVVTLVAASTLAGCSLLPNALNPDSRSAVGSDAKDLVSAGKYPNLLIQLDYPSGYEPNDAALSDFVSVIAQATGRDASHITFDKEAVIPAEPGKKYTWDEIQGLENAHRTKHTGGDTAAVYMVYVAGGSQEDTGNGVVLGAAYHGTSIVMFKGNIQANSGTSTLSGKPPEQYVERAVLIHEFGHAMGLVNLGAPMVHPHEDTTGDGTGQDGHDPARHGHSTDRNSVMYWAVESSAGLSGLVNCLASPNDCGIPWHFDSDDLADLNALRSS